MTCPHDIYCFVLLIFAIEFPWPVSEWSFQDIQTAPHFMYQLRKTFHLALKVAERTSSFRIGKATLNTPGRHGTEPTAASPLRKSFSSMTIILPALSTRPNHTVSYVSSHSESASRGCRLQSRQRSLWQRTITVKRTLKSLGRVFASHFPDWWQWLITVPPSRLRSNFFVEDFKISGGTRSILGHCKTFP